MKKMFGYNLSFQGERAVGVVMAENAKEAEEIVIIAFRLNPDLVTYSSFEELKFSKSGICEIFYGC